jgi:hypothetical protein
MAHFYPLSDALLGHSIEQNKFSVTILVSVKAGLWLLGLLSSYSIASYVIILSAGALRSKKLPDGHFRDLSRMAIRAACRLLEKVPGCLGATQTQVFRDISKVGGRRHELKAQIGGA